MPYLNQDHINNLIEQINKAPDCQSLQKLVEDQIKVYFDKLLADFRRGIAALAPLINVPTDIDGVIRWLTTYIALISGPYYKLIALEAELIATYAQIISVVTAAMSKLKCTFTPPNLLS